MTNYLYKTIIFKDTSNVIGIDNTQNDIDKTDFETNRKSQTLPVSSLSLLDTTFIIEESYTLFSARIVNPRAWSDVKMIENDHYSLYLLSDTAL